MALDAKDFIDLITLGAKGALGMTSTLGNPNVGEHPEWYIKTIEEFSNKAAMVQIIEAEKRQEIYQRYNESLQAQAAQQRAQQAYRGLQQIAPLQLQQLLGAGVYQGQYNPYDGTAAYPTGLQSIIQISTVPNPPMAKPESVMPSWLEDAEQKFNNVAGTL